MPVSVSAVHSHHNSFQRGIDWYQLHIYIYIHLTCCCSFNPILGLPCATRHPSIAREPFYALRFCANTHKQISIYSFCFCSCENIKLATMYNMYMGGNRALDQTILIVFLPNEPTCQSVYAVEVYFLIQKLYKV